MYIELKHCQFKHPSNLLVVGMTGSGKTVLIRRILKNFNQLFHNLNKQQIKVLWCYGQWHNLIDLKIDENVAVIYMEGLPSEKDIIDSKPDIIIIDDLLNEMSKNQSFENLFIKKSHHLNISVVFSVQNLFYNAKNMRTISLNSHYILIMKNPRDKAQILNLARQIYPSNTKFLIESFNEATKLAYGYIRIDLTPDTPESFRVQSSITPEENVYKRLTPIIYIPKNV